MAEIITHKLAELFCGPGGIGLGAKLAAIASKGKIYKIISVWANDIDRDSCDTYRINFHPNDPKSVICGPVSNTLIKKIPFFDGLTFGFPCNDFSIVGEQKGIHGKFGKLYSFGANTLDTHNPRWFIAENVGDNKGQIFLDKSRIN